MRLEKLRKFNSTAMFKCSLWIFLAICFLLGTSKATKDVKDALSNSREENESEYFDNDEYREACQCGVFMSKQLGAKSGRRSRLRSVPEGEPVINYNTEMFDLPCNTTGKKICITQCVDVLMGYLPQAGIILCGAVDRDVDREQAFLYIKNCGSDWLATSFSAGREFCCTDGENHPC